MKWRVYSQRKEAEPSEFLGILAAPDRDTAIAEAAKAWKDRRFLLVSEATWAVMDTRGRSFFEGSFAVSGGIPYQQISVDVRSCRCQKCGNEVFYRRRRNGHWRNPPPFCPTCDPRRLIRNHHPAYVDRPATDSRTDVDLRGGV